MAMTFTLTLSPTARIADGCLIRLAQIWGDVDEAGEAVSEADEGAVWLQALNGSFGDEADFYVGDFLFALFVCFLAENFAGGEDQAVFFFVEVKTCTECLCLSIHSDLPRSSGRVWKPG